MSFTLSLFVIQILPALQLSMFSRFCLPGNKKPLGSSGVYDPTKAPVQRRLNVG